MIFVPLKWKWYGTMLQPREINFQINRRVWTRIVVWLRASIAVLTYKRRLQSVRFWTNVRKKGFLNCSPIFHNCLIDPVKFKSQSKNEKSYQAKPNPVAHFQEQKLKGEIQKLVVFEDSNKVKIKISCKIVK
jgi:hypothetical protein